MAHVQGSCPVGSGWQSMPVKQAIIRPRMNPCKAVILSGYRRIQAYCAEPHLKFINHHRSDIMTHKIDHFAIGCSSLAAGVASLKTSLGVEVPQGSKHDMMSTHNCVMQSGNESFLELIAIDPDAPAPDRTRWFTLDDPETTRRLAQRPRALCWVVSTDNLDGIVASSPVNLGEIVTFFRGERSWRLTVPADGHLPENALLPAFIEWSPGPHPSSAQQDLDVTLERVILTHPDPESISGMLATLKVDHLATVVQGAQPALSFELATPGGVVTID